MSSSKDIYKDVWDAEYKAGAWKYLESLDTGGRLSVVATYIHYGRSRPSVLDVGCGHGVLSTYINLNDISSYTGIDISKEAIKQGKELTRNHEKLTFIESSIEEFNSDLKFDVVVFSDSLCYLSDPLQSLEKYKKFLAPGGSFVINLYKMKEVLRHTNQFIDTKEMWVNIQKKFRIFHFFSISSAVSRNQHDVALIFPLGDPPDTYLQSSVFDKIARVPCNGGA